MALLFVPCGLYKIFLLIWISNLSKENPYIFKMPKQLPLSAYKEIKSGCLSKRQAIEKYKISQARFMKIRGPINPTPEEVIWSALERRSLTDKEKKS